MAKMDINQAIKLKKMRAFPVWKEQYIKSMGLMGKAIEEKAKQSNDKYKEKKQKNYAWEMNKAINAFFKMNDCTRIDPRLDE